MMRTPFRFLLALVLLGGFSAVVLQSPTACADEPTPGFEITPFALPNCDKNEVRFEEPRDIVAVEVTYDGPVPAGVGLSYLQQYWPTVKLERAHDLTQPCQFGWTVADDWFNTKYRPAKAKVVSKDGDRARVEFKPLTAEFPEQKDYDVAFRRTLGIRVDGVDANHIKRVRVWSASHPAKTTLTVELNAGGTSTPGGSVGFDTYNADVRGVKPVSGCKSKDGAIQWDGNGPAEFQMEVDHMTPSFRYSGDDGHVRFLFYNDEGLARFLLKDDSFTISLTSLKSQGPIWFAEKGIFIKEASDLATAEQYIARTSRAKTIAEKVKGLSEQTYAGAFQGQPRPHSVAHSLGFKHTRQRFWQDSNGDLTLEGSTVRQIPAGDTERYANDNGAHGRFFFGLEGWMMEGRYPDPAPALTYHLRAHKDDIEVEQTSFAAPLDGRVLDGPIAADRELVCLMRFRFKNVGLTEQPAKLHLEYSSSSGRSPDLYARGTGAAEWQVPRSEREKLALDGELIHGDWHGKSTLRGRIETAMTGKGDGWGLTFLRDLAPGATCEVVLKVPFVNLDKPEELDQLKALQFDSLRTALAEFWKQENAQGAQIRTPVAQLNELHQAHLTYVQISDSVQPDDPGLINTSVGTSTYGNCGNESCMINQELDQRGLIDDARRRLEVWVKYQGSEPLSGLFSDHEGVLHGAGSYSFSASYNQNHGWILWRLAEHYLYTRDNKWFEHVTPTIISACDWVFRQRQLTMKDLPHSRGWERGFLPAGALEDIGEFRYWLTTNTMIWRGVDSAARALEAAGHPEAARIRQEADAYGNDLRKGFETMRQHSPLVRLRSGRWVPYYPSQLYRRGRDIGWIRETLEGSDYLLLSGLYDPRSPQAQWILDDYQDNRYMSPPYGYAIVDEENDWFDRGGFSIQPNLLAGLLPYLDRDEPEVYIWMFFNAWMACYREEINAMVEHPMPVLGYNNIAHPKTSDEANAVMWLRYLFVYGPSDGLYLGRAVPRAWLAQAEPIGLDRVHTRWGEASVKYTHGEGDTLHAKVSLNLKAKPPKTILQFRHPKGKPIQSVTINGREHKAFDAEKEDVDLSGLDGQLDIEARF